MTYIVCFCVTYLNLTYVICFKVTYLNLTYIILFKVIYLNPTYNNLFLGHLHADYNDCNILVARRNGYDSILVLVLTLYYGR